MYMELGLGCGSMLDRIFRLNKTLYGLKHTTRQFYNLLVSRLIEIGLEQRLLHPCVINFIIDGVLAKAVVIHVGGIGFAGVDLVSNNVVEALNNTLPTKHLGELSWYMGIGYRPDGKASTIEKSQTSYIGSALERFDVSWTSAVSAFPSVHLRTVKEDNNAEGVPFREVVRSFMLIANQTRLDIANAVRASARHSHDSKENPWKAAQKIIAYLRATAQLKPEIPADLDVGIHWEYMLILTLQVRIRKGGRFQALQCYDVIYP